MGETVQCDHLADLQVQCNCCPFRLLTIDDFTDDGTLHISLRQGVESHNVVYRALSYTWENETASVPIVCNGTRTSITQSLYQALRYVDIYSGRGFPHWIDQICISQHDEEDKALQVPLISKIFKDAEMVMIWLGDSSPQIDHLISRLPQFCQNLWRSNDLIDFQTDDVLRFAGLPLISDPIWQGLWQLFTKSWFTRLWTIQEVCLARRAVFLCGRQSVDHEVVTLVARQLRSRGLHSLLNGGFGIPAFNSLNFQSNLRTIINQNLPDDATLSQILLQARPLCTSEPIDKAYAVIGLLNPETRAQIKVDYSADSRRQYWNAYVDLCHQILQRRLGFQVLIQAASRDRPIGLPSWCPNLDRTRPNRTFLTTRYHAGGAGDRLTSHIATSIDRRRLTLMGIETEQVHEVVPPGFNFGNESEYEYDHATNAKKSLLWIEHCISIARSINPHSTHIPLNLIRAFIGNLLQQPDQYDPPEDVIRIAFDLLVSFLSGAAGQAEAQSTYTQEAVSRIWRCLRRLYETCYNRSCFSTTAGRFGIGPEETRPGDQVAVFRGCVTPLLLRAQKDGLLAQSGAMSSVVEGQRLFRLVGEVYVQGLMNGEVFNDESVAVMHEEAFILA